MYIFTFILGQAGSRPPSRQSMLGVGPSVCVADLHDLDTLGVGSGKTASEENLHDLGAESMRLSLMAKAKAVQDQVSTNTQVLLVISLQNYLIRYPLSISIHDKYIIGIQIFSISFTFLYMFLHRPLRLRFC